MTMGIYGICNLCDGKATAYVGSSTDLEARWRFHQNHLRCGIHHNVHLQRAWDMYGDAAFEWSVIEEVTDKAGLLLREQHWLDRYFENPSSCYNFARCATAPMQGLKHSEAARAKMSKVHKGNKRGLGYHHTAEAKQKIRDTHAKPYPAFIHRERGEIIPAGLNLRRLCRECGLAENSRGLRKVIAGTQSHHKGWTLLKEDNDD